MRAETLRAGEEERVRKRSRQHTVEVSSQRREEGEQPAATPQSSMVSMSLCRGGQCFAPPALPSLLHGPPRQRGQAGLGGSRAWGWQPPGDIGIASVQPRGVGESPNSTLNFMWTKVRPALLDREQGQREGTVVAAGAGPEAKGWS